MCYDVSFLLTCLFGPSGVSLRSRRRFERHFYKGEQISVSSLRMMEVNYDEDIAVNPFFLKLKEDFTFVLKEVIEQGWVICVPRYGTFANDNLVVDDVLGHVLLPHNGVDRSTLYTLNGRKIRLENKVLTLDNGVSGCCTSYLLFEETFYTKDREKYLLWCIERPLSHAHPSVRNDLAIVTNVQECMNFLWTEVRERRLLKELESSVEAFMCSHSCLDKESLPKQKDLVGALYEDCLRTIMRDSELREKAVYSGFFLNNARIAVETYVLYELRKVLARSIATCVALEDAKLNKAVRNLQDVQPSDVGVHENLQDGITRGKLELSRLSGLSTVLGKIECLKRTVRYVTEGAPCVSSDDLLPVLIFLVVKVGTPNWMAQLSFLKHFRFSATSSHEADQGGFLVTTLEAAIEHVASGKMSNSLQWPSPPLENETPLYRLFAAIQRSELSQVQGILSMGGQNGESIFCHPLCRCDSCEGSRADSANWSLTARTTDERGVNALHVASSLGRVAIVDFLLNHGANVDESDVDGQTPLHYASVNGHQATILLLLYAKADPTVADMRGNTALHLAADRGHEDCVKALLYFAEQAGFPLAPSPVNVHGDTPLHYASKWAYHGIAVTLVEHGADTRLRNKRGQTPVSLAHSPGIVDVLETLQTTARHRAQSICTRASAGQQDHESVKRAKSESRIEKPCRPRRSVARDLVQDGDENGKYECEDEGEDEDEDENEHENEDVGMSTKKKSGEQRRANRLFAAVKVGDVRLARYYLGLELLDSPRGARSEDKLCHPLCDCERCGISSSDSNGDSVQVRRSRESEVLADMTRLTKVRNEKGENALHLAAAAGFADIVGSLLDAGANVNALTRLDGRTALHIASMRNNLEVVRLLLSSPKCDVNAKDRLAGDTALHLALKAGHGSIAVCLLSSGANPRMPNSSGLVASSIVKNQPEFATIVEMLHEERPCPRKSASCRSVSADFSPESLCG